MPRRKTKNKEAKNQEIKKTKKQKIREVRSKETLLKIELNYFKGLSILLTILIVCVFFAYAALFSAMYVETKIISTNLQKLFVDYGQEEAGSSLEEKNQIKEEKTAADWPDFSKYGVSVHFPSDWTYLDKPFDKEIHFYADGRVREPGDEDSGDFYVKIVKEYQKPLKAGSAKLVVLNRKVAEQYDYALNTGKEVITVITPLDDQYLELHFITDEANMIIDDVLKQIEL